MRTKLGLFGFGLFLTGCGPDGLVRYDHPLSYAEAKNHQTDFPFPPSSHDIYYGVYADWQVYVNIVRFSAPVQDCRAEVATVLKWQSAVQKCTFADKELSVSHVDPASADALEPTNWFPTQTITNGLHVGKTGGHKPEMWIDLDRGIFYYRETD